MSLIDFVWNLICGCQWAVSDDFNWVLYGLKPVKKEWFIGIKIVFFLLKTFDLIQKQ